MGGIVIGWGGNGYPVAEDLEMRVVDAIEDFITADELFPMLTDGKFKRGKLAGAYAAVLNLVGCEVTHKEVYKAFYDEATSTDAMFDVTGGLGAMLGLAQLPAELQDDSEASEGEGDPKPMAEDS